MVDFIRRSLYNAIELGRTNAAERQFDLLSDTSSFDFARNGNQFGVAANGDLVLSTQDVSAHIFGEGILLEGARTNLNTDSEDLSAASWIKSLSVINTEVTVAPDGASTADRIIDDALTGVGTVQIFSQPTITATQHTFSVFCKRDQLNWVGIRTSGFDTSGTSFFDLLNGVVGTKDVNHISSGIQAFGNDWFRCWVVFTSATDLSGNTGVRVAEADLDDSVDRDGTSSIFTWGAQLEPGCAPSSYIPTSGATASRATTDMQRPWPFPANGISELIIWRPQYDATDDKGSDLQIINMSDGTENNYLRVTVDQTNDQIHLKKRVSAGTEVVVSTAVSALNYVKGDRKSVRIVADGNGLDLWVDALAKVGIATGDAPTDWTTKLTTIELPPSFHTVESSRVWNRANPDSFMGSLI
jgi:hypothetical protein